MKRGSQGNPSLAVAYLRVSTDQQELGPEAQRAAIERWASSRGVAVVSFHVDHGVSGGAELEKRPGLQSALDDLRARGAGLLVVAKRDRLARDIVLAALFERLTQNEGARVVSAAGEGGEDANDPSSQLMRNIIDCFAQYERALIRSRTKAALGVKKIRGERVGGIPFGRRLGADGKTLEVATDEAAARERIRELRASGVSIRGIVSKLAAEGVVGRTGKPICKASVERIVRAAE